LFNKYGEFSQVHKTGIGIRAIFGLIAIFFYNYSSCTFGKESFPRRRGIPMPEQFLKLFFKTIGVVKDRPQSLCLDRQPASQGESVMYNSGNLSEYSFGKDHNLFLMILFFAIVHEGYPIEENKTEEDDTSQSRLCRHSDKIPLNQYSITRNEIPVGSLTPLKQTGIYEKGDRYQ
jgi:hypothetical protein